MMRLALLAAVLGLLAACGVDGEPETPAGGVKAGGVKVGGDAYVGIVGRV